MEVGTQTSQESNEEGFVDLVASKYKLLRALYPDKELTFTELSKIVDKKILSDSQKPLKDAGLIELLEKKRKETGRSNKFFKLTLDGVKILSCIIRLRGTPHPHSIPSEKFLEDALLLLKEDKTQDLAADQIQMIPRETRVSANSALFLYIQNNLMDLKSDHVKSVLLLSLQSVLRYSELESRENIIGKVMNIVKQNALEHPKERSGAISQLIIKEFFINELLYENLETQYLDAIKTGTVSVDSIEGLIIDKFPDKKIELRGKLLEKLIKADYVVSQRIKRAFNRLY